MCVCVWFGVHVCMFVSLCTHTFVRVWLPWYACGSLVSHHNFALDHRLLIKIMKQNGSFRDNGTMRSANPSINHSCVCVRMWLSVLKCAYVVQVCTCVCVVLCA